MKRILICLMIAGLTLAVAAPLMAATSVDMSGYYDVEGYWNDNPDGVDDGDSDAWYEHKFRLKTVFNANDNVSVTTRLDALDNEKWGTRGTPTGNNDNIDLDRVYMTIKSQIGLFQIGRQSGGAWGLAFGDDEEDYDRIKYILPIGDFTLIGIIQKNDEEDSILSSDDEDTDCYYLAGIYKQDTWEAGLLSAYARAADSDKDVTGLADGLAGFSPQINGEAGTMTKYVLAPYAKAMFGPFGLQGEIIYEWGEFDFDDNAVEDIDIDTLAYNLEGSFNMDMGKIFGGLAVQQGQDPGNTTLDAATFALSGGTAGYYTDEINMGCTTYSGIGDDFNPLAIFTDDLGGQPLNSNNFDALGVNLLYTGAEFALNDALTLRGAAGMAWANEDDWADDAGVDDEYGWEIDFGLDYQIMDNLTYSATIGYADVGELLAAGQDAVLNQALTNAATVALGGTATDLADPNEDAVMGMVHKIKVTF